MVTGCPLRIFHGEGDQDEGHAQRLVSMRRGAKQRRTSRGHWHSAHDLPSARTAPKKRGKGGVASSKHPKGVVERLFAPAAPSFVRFGEASLL
eukprot:4366244-Amphidinium_carterae.1